MLSGIIFSGMAVLLYLAALMLALRAPRCPTCETRLQCVGETAKTLGLYTVETLVYYECSDCYWVTQRRHIFTPL
jgi:hypothetical protein